MKGRTGSMGVETTHEVPEKPTPARHEKDRQTFLSRGSLFQHRLGPIRVVLAAGGLVIAILLGIFFVSYGSKLYQNWRENRLLYQATALLQEGKLNKAAQIAREILARHPDSLPALYILAETAERENLEEAVSWRERIARLLPKNPESQLNFASAARSEERRVGTEWR